ncbi:MAG: NAD-dependent epimerase/dehydratase family protein [Anaeromyxobacteraceae bacterium]
MPTALITGAAGFLGRALVRRLLAGGYGVRGLVRRPAPEGVLDAAVEQVVGDATEAAALARAVSGCDVVFHLAGVRRATDAAEFMRVNAGSTRLLLEACLAAGAARQRFVLAGSLAAVGPSAAPRVEEDPLAPVEPYGASKAEAERIVFGFADRLPVSVGRPPRIMGPGDRENLLFFRIAAKGFVLRFGGAERPLSWIDVDDCAEGFALLADRREARGEAFFVASSEVTNVTQLQRDIARALGVASREIAIPARAVELAARAADVVTDLTGHRLPLNRKLARQVLAPGWTCSAAKAERVLGFRATTPLATSLARAAHSYRELGLV